MVFYYFNNQTYSQLCIEKKLLRDDITSDFSFLLLIALGIKSDPVTCTATCAAKYS